MSPDGSVELGCIYIDPSVKEGFDANVQMWVRESERDTGLDGRLFRDREARGSRATGRSNDVAYPGREIARAEWDALPPTVHAGFHA